MKLRGKINQCPACEAYFSTVSVFDRHRVGRFGTGLNGSSPERRCENPSEMRFQGLQLDERGVWRGESRQGDSLNRSWRVAKST